MKKFKRLEDIVLKEYNIERDKSVNIYFKMRLKEITGNPSHYSPFSYIEIRDYILLFYKYKIGLFLIAHSKKVTNTLFDYFETFSDLESIIDYYGINIIDRLNIRNYFKELK
jgi:hypothetical protein